MLMPSLETIGPAIWVPMSSTQTDRHKDRQRDRKNKMLIVKMEHLNEISFCWPLSNRGLHNARAFMIAEYIKMSFYNEKDRRG